MRVTVCLFVLSCVFVPVVARAADAELPAAVAAALEETVDLCTGAGGKAQTAGAVKRADLTDDGKEDFVLYAGSIRCDGAASIYGDREKSVQVFAGDGAGGAASVFSGMSFDARLEGGKLWLLVMGADCGSKPAADFANESFCLRPLEWNAKSMRLEYAPVSMAKGVSMDGC